MKQVMKKFPDTKWAQLAAFHLLDNKLCGDWQGSSKCPDKEADIYEKYVKEHPESPAAPEALYNAASRRAALIEIYKTEEQPKKSEPVEEPGDRARPAVNLAISAKRLVVPRTNPAFSHAARSADLRERDTVVGAGTHGSYWSCGDAAWDSGAVMKSSFGAHLAIVLRYRISQ